MSTRLKFALLATIAVGLLGCDGRLALEIGDEEMAEFAPLPTSQDPNESEPPPGTIMRPPEEQVEDEVCQFISPGDASMRRLTVEEYHNAVRDLFPFAQIPNQAFSPDDPNGNFKANTVTAVNDLQAEQYLRASEAVADVVVANLDSVLDPNADEAAVREWIATYGMRAFRRPLESTEVDALYTIFDAGRTEYDAQTGAQMVVESLLQSPFFLYRIEVGEPTEEEVVELTDYELASRMSFFLWGSIPDDSLLSVAGNEGLSSKGDIEAQARRMLNDPRARARINDVFSQWLQIDELENLDRVDPAFNDEMRESMLAETQAFIDHIIWEADGSVETLLTADYTFVDSNTASLYGVEAGAEDGMVRVDMPAGRRGILSLPGVLSTHGHGQMPTYRGKFVRDAFFCLPTADPPDDIEPLETFEGESLRSKSEKRMNATEEGCASCHLQMDGIGLVFDNYDSLGRYQTEDEFGNALDDTGHITGTQETDAQIDGVEQLADALASSDEVKACVSKQFFRYAFARMTGGGDECSLHMIDQALQSSNGDIKELLVAITTTDAFRYRKSVAAEN